MACYVMTKDQLDEVLNSLIDVDGDFCTETEIGKGVTIEASGQFVAKMECEDDYYNGTGGWVEVGRHAEVQLEAVTYDEDGCEIDREDVCEEQNEKALEYLYGY